MQTFSHKKPATPGILHTVRGVPTCTLRVISFQNVSFVLHRRNLSKGNLFSKINKGGGSFIDSLLIVIPVLGVLIVVGFCCTLLYIHSSFAIILMGKRELVALLGVSSWCLLVVVWLFLVKPWVLFRFVIVVFSDHTHLLF